MFEIVSGTPNKKLCWPPWPVLIKFQNGSFWFGGGFVVLTVAVHWSLSPGYERNLEAVAGLRSGNCISLPDQRCVRRRLEILAGRNWMLCKCLARNGRPLPNLPAEREYGEGALLIQGKPVAYYNTVSASFGFQLGAQVVPSS